MGLMAVSIAEAYPSTGRILSLQSKVGTIHSFFQWSTDIRSVTITDPFFLAAGKHFDNVFKRHGTPLIILNLIKVRQSYFKGLPPLICSLPVAWASRSEAPQCVDYLNQFLPEGNEILLRAWYMSHAYEESVPPDGRVCSRPMVTGRRKMSSATSKTLRRKPSSLQSFSFLPRTVLPYAKKAIG